MRRIVASLFVCFLAVLPSLADTEVSGRTPGGAYYAIAVPDAWNGSLVIWNHGFSLSPPGPVTDLGPLVDVQLLQGFAVAASSYRQAGWAVFKTNQDLRAMVAAFRDQFGEPESIYVYGASLGGIVTAAAIEKGNLGNVVGALSICGVVGGSRVWDGALDLRLLYDQVCSNTPAAFIPGGAEGLPKNSAITTREVERAVNACTGVDLSPSQRNGRQKRNLKALTRVSGLPESFLQTVMGYVTFGMSDLVHSRDKLRSRVGTSNRGVDYGNRKVNDRIERVSADRRAGRRLKRSFSPTGRVGDVKIVAVHTDKDGLVLVENLGAYAEVVPAGNLTAAVVVEQVPSHCFFSPSEVLTVWDGLTTWVGSGVQPSAQDLQDVCVDLVPVFGGPCRIDPGFQIPDMDGRVRPR